MSLYILSFLTNFDPESLHSSIGEAEQGSVNSIFVYVDFFDLHLANLLLNCIFFSHVDISDINEAQLISHVEEFLFLIPADGSVKYFVWVTDAEDVLLLTNTLYGLVIANCEGARFLFDVENLNHSIPMYSSFLVLKFKFAFLTPFFWSLKLKKRPL